MHVALGWDYRGRCVKHGPVVYVAAEGAHGFQARIEAFRREKPIERDGPVEFYLMPSRLDLVREVEELIEDIGTQAVAPIMVVIDTLNRTLTGSESRDEDMAAYINAADTIREAFNCAAVIVHHCGIDGTRPRGHTSLAGAVDTQIKVSKSDDGCITTEIEKAKDGPEGDKTHSRLEVVVVGFDADDDPITSCVIVEADEPPATRSMKLTGAAKVALDALSVLIGDCGEAVPASNYSPSGIKGIRVDTWRDACYLATISDGSTDAKRKAFKRASMRLRDVGAIGVWNEWVWLVGR